MDTNALPYKGSKGMKPMTYNNVTDGLNLKAEQGYRFFKRMKDIGVIKEVNAAVVGGRKKWLVVKPSTLLRANTLVMNPIGRLRRN